MPRPPPSTVGASALQLAKSILLSSSSNQDRNKGLRELTQILTTTNPPLFTPRVPTPYVATLEQQQRLQTIQARAATILPDLLVLDQSEEDLQKKQENTQSNQTYGTTPAETIFTLLNVLYPHGSSDPQGSFIDAGSGQGIPALAAALSNKFHLARGIEYEPKWHCHAMALQKAYQENTTELQLPKACPLDYRCGDMTIPASFEGASFVFSNCVLFDAELCQSVSHRLEEDLATKDDVFVVTMSRRLALPSFDLVDVLSLNANEGLFTFYLNQKANIGTSLFHATSDSETMRLLRESNDTDEHEPPYCWEELIEFALLESDPKVGMPFLIAIAASEPSTRTLGQHVALWNTLQMSMDGNLPTKALGSMLLRAMVDHPTGRRSVTMNADLCGRIIAMIGDDTEHPAVRTNLLDVVSNLLHDAPLSQFSDELDGALGGRGSGDDDDEDEAGNSINEALEECLTMRRWWEGHQRGIPGIRN